MPYWLKRHLTSSLTDISAANVCIKKNQRSLSCICEEIFQFCPCPFSEIVAILTGPAVNVNDFLALGVLAGLPGCGPLDKSFQYFQIKYEILPSPRLPYQ